MAELDYTHPPSRITRHASAAPSAKSWVTYSQQPPPVPVHDPAEDDTVSSLPDPYARRTPLRAVNASETQSIEEPMGNGTPQLDFSHNPPLVRPPARRTTGESLAFAGGSSQNTTPIVAPLRPKAKKQNSFSSMFKSIRKLPKTMFGYGVASGVKGSKGFEPRRQDTAATDFSTATSATLPAYTPNPTRPLDGIDGQFAPPGGLRPYYPDLNSRIADVPPPEVVRIGDHRDTRPSFNISPPSPAIAREEQAEYYEGPPPPGGYQQYHGVDQNLDSTFVDPHSRTTVMVYGDEVDGRQSHIPPVPSSFPDRRVPSGPRLSYGASGRTRPLPFPGSGARPPSTYVPPPLEPLEEVLSEAASPPSMPVPLTGSIPPLSPPIGIGRSSPKGAPPTPPADVVTSPVSIEPHATEDYRKMSTGMSVSDATPPSTPRSHGSQPHSARHHPHKSHSNSARSQTHSHRAHHHRDGYGQQEYRTGYGVPPGYQPRPGPRPRARTRTRSRRTTWTMSYLTTTSMFSERHPIESFFKLLYRLPWVARERVTVDYLPGAKSKGGKKKDPTKLPRSWYTGLLNASKRNSGLDLLSNGTGTVTEGSRRTGSVSTGDPSIYSHSRVTHDSEERRRRHRRRRREREHEPMVVPYQAFPTYPYSFPIPVPATPGPGVQVQPTGQAPQPQPVQMQMAPGVVPITLPISPPQHGERMGGGKRRRHRRDDPDVPQALQPGYHGHPHAHPSGGYQPFGTPIYVLPNTPHGVQVPMGMGMLPGNLPPGMTMVQVSGGPPVAVNTSGPRPKRTKEGTVQAQIVGSVLQVPASGQDASQPLPPKLEQRKSTQTIPGAFDGAASP